MTLGRDTSQGLVNVTMERDMLAAKLREVEKFAAQVEVPSRHVPFWRRGFVNGEWVASSLRYILGQPVDPDEPQGWRITG